MTIIIKGSNKLKQYLWLLEQKNKERLIFGSLTAENRDTRYYHNFQIL